MKCPKCEHEFDDEISEWTEEDRIAMKNYQQAGLEYLKRFNAFAEIYNKTEDTVIDEKGQSLP